VLESPRAPSMPAPPPPASTYTQELPRPGGPSAAALEKRLMDVILQRGLQTLYPAARVVALVQQLARVDWGGVARAWRIGVDKALDLAALALYDIAILGGRGEAEKTSTASRKWAWAQAAQTPLDTTQGRKRSLAESSSVRAQFASLRGARSTDPPSLLLEQHESYYAPSARS